MHQAPRPLAIVWPNLLKNKVFIAGLIFKIILIILFVPDIQREWFVPFIIETIEFPSISPWLNFLDSGGSVSAFPYGSIMLLAHLPSTFLGWLIDTLTGFNYFSGLGFRLSLLGADFLLLSLLLQQFEKYWNGLLVHYWLSPIIIFITYWHGQTDLIPVVLFFFSVILLRNNKLIASGFSLAAAIAAKHSMIIALPFVLVYLWFKRNIIRDVSQFIIYLLLALLLFEGLLLFDAGFQQMVLGSKEIDKVFWLFIAMGDQIKVYVLPLVYTLLLYFTWRLRRMNYELLLSSLGVAFGIVILLTPASVGWFLWIAPILALHYSQKNGGAVTLGILFNIIFVIYHLIYSSGSQLILSNDIAGLIDKAQIIENLHIQSILNTILFSFFSIIVLQIYRNGIRGNDYYHLGKRPLVIGISGKAESGKSAFTDALTGLFGRNKTLELHGKNYFNWRQDSPMWKTITRYNPRSSQNFSMISDLRRLLNNELVSIMSFNHKKGVFSKEKKFNGNQVILVSGFHTLHYKQLLEMQDVGFFIISKESIKEERQEKIDSDKYIKPQISQADVVYKIPKIDNHSDNYASLDIVILNGIYYQELLRILIGVCGLQVSVDESDGDGTIKLAIQGEIQFEDTRFASNLVVPHLNEFIDQENGFLGGTLGVMQLVTLMEIDEILKQRKR
ncbi:MAG TPA: hypothetical protein EYQ71_09165 [Candidatus Thioglobus sp.]|nr:hypothetical protein [Candidatus Thioglobus sp.]